MKKYIEKFAKHYESRNYYDKKKAEYTAVLLPIVSTYALITCFLFSFEGLLVVRRYYIILAVIVSFLSLLKGRLELSQNILISIPLVLMSVFYKQVELFHFYGEMIILLFVTLIVYVRRYQYAVVLIAIIMSFYGRYQMTNSYIFILDYNRTQSSQHLFIITTLLMLIPLGFYVDRMIHRSIHENRLLEASVHIDSLTELYTRSKFNDDINDVLSQEKQMFNEIAILDIDKFKIINDSYGHHAGDIILQRLANEMKRKFSEPTYRVYRWGGEEFIVLSADKTPELFDEKLNDFRAYVAETITMNDLNVTISIGSTHLEELSFKRTFCRADNALYKAKSLGRNRLVRREETSECFEMETTKSI